MRGKKVLSPFYTMIFLIVGILLSIFPNHVSADSFIVRDGKPNAEIVISEKPTRMSKLAAEELRDYIRKMSGAELLITFKPNNNFPVKIYVGKSTYTDQLKINDDGLDYDAFRMVSGQNWLVLLGNDSNFTPREPWARNNADQERMLKEWDAKTEAKWGNPIGGSIYRNYSSKWDMWQFDRRGSLNAVYEFLRSLGVRWYMPGELGEIVPEMRTIKIPEVEKMVRPDFALRSFHFAFYFMSPKEDILWYLRLGLNHGQEVMGYGEPGHGMRSVPVRDEMKKAHPEYYALYNGVRATSSGYYDKPCLSSEGLFQEHVKYVRAMFDIYNEQMVSIMPTDGYANMCRCELCAGKDTPERGWDGTMSDYVWNYVNRVAVEVYKTHPDRKVNCFAYGTYKLPPLHIDKLSPNLVVGITQMRRFNYHQETYSLYYNLRQMWLEKSMAGELLIWDHYPFTLPGKPWAGVPAYFPHLIAEDLRSLKGISKGEFIEVMFDPDRGMGLHAPGFNHLNLYITARLYWDASQDVDVMLNEYYKKFYGPAAREMKVFIEYCESNWRYMATASPWMQKDQAVIDEARALLTTARNVAGDNVYGQRIDLVVEYMKLLK